MSSKGGGSGEGSSSFARTASVVRETVALSVSRNSGILTWFFAKAVTPVTRASLVTRLVCESKLSEFRQCKRESERERETAGKGDQVYTGDVR